MQSNTKPTALYIFSLWTVYTSSRRKHNKRCSVFIVLRVVLRRTTQILHLILFHLITVFHRSTADTRYHALYLPKVKAIRTVKWIGKMVILDRRNRVSSLYGLACAADMTQPDII